MVTFVITFFLMQCLLMYHCSVHLTTFNVKLLSLIISGETVDWKNIKTHIFFNHVFSLSIEIIIKQE